jgi:hypothetical protein
LDGVLLRVVLRDSQRLEFLWEEEVTKSRREGREAVVITRRRSLLAPQLLDLLAGVIAAL